MIGEEGLLKNWTEHNSYFFFHLFLGKEMEVEESGRDFNLLVLFTKNNEEFLKQ